MHYRKKIITLFLLGITIVSAVVLLQNCKPSSSSANTSNNIWENNQYIGDAQCRSCHQKEYEDWKISDHYMAMQPATDSTVLGDFNNATLTADGVTNKFLKKEGKYFINTEGPDGENHDFEILYTFGYKPLQQYLVQFPDGKMQATRASWDTEKKKWFHQYGGQKLNYHGDWLHWTKGGQNWNTMCAYCHSTNLQKKYNAETESFHTTYDVINVSCETCHGPAKKHVDYIESDDYKEGKKIAGSYLFTTIDKNNKAQVDMCGPCHMRGSRVSDDLMHTAELMDDFIPEIPSTQFFHADGQINDEDYNYTSFLQSKMYHREVKCSNCHNPHSGKVLYTNNQLCRQCHAESYDSPAHTFHTTGTEGASCVSCHMPGKYYMGNDYRHDHSFRVPRPDLSVQYNTPNACNNCHKDKGFQWAATAVKKWYGEKRQYHFSDDLIPGSLLNAQSETRLNKLIGDTSVPDIVKATAAYYLGNITTASSFQTLLQCLQYPDAQVRFRALKSLQNFPAQQWMSVAGAMLSDKVRAVRIAAADLYTAVPMEQMPENFREPFSKAKNELLASLNSQLDFPVGSLNMGDYYRRNNDLLLAEKYYKRALKQDSLMNITRINLSSVYNSLQKNQQALELMQQAVKIEPANSHAYYSLALLQVEMKEGKSALQNFEKAVQLKTNNARVYYNYGLLLQQFGKVDESMKILQKGVALEADNTDLLYALSFLYMQKRDMVNAKNTATHLKQLAPYNENYTQLYRALGI